MFSVVRWPSSGYRKRRFVDRLKKDDPISLNPFFTKEGGGGVLEPIFFAQSEAPRKFILKVFTEYFVIE